MTKRCASLTDGIGRTVPPVGCVVALCGGEHTTERTDGRAFGATTQPRAAEGPIQHHELTPSAPSNAAVLGSCVWALCQTTRGSNTDWRRRCLRFCVPNLGESASESKRNFAPIAVTYPARPAAHSHRTTMYVGSAVDRHPEAVSASSHRRQRPQSVWRPCAAKAICDAPF